ncbi:hypothetical protein BB560_006765 [Smittium megazygosporum]|uniref:Uncharacterized protein n=1 Tax=Smittium megazygosporum TaxID=133381 RepID=A0A2T9Y1U5_9FUNG|nr:hypothetical protein BB560_006765 [Smittium megazygosporum]
MVTDIPRIENLPSKSGLDPGLVSFIKIMTPIANKMIFNSIVRYVKNNRYSLAWIKTVSIDALYAMSTQSQITSALNIKYPTVSCNTFVANTQALTTCVNSDQYFFNDGTSPTTRVHALVGAVFSQIINSTSFSYSAPSILSVINKYNVTSAGTFQNFLFLSNSSMTGIVNVSSYTLDNATESATVLSNLKNSAGSILINKVFVLVFTFVCIILSI